MTTYNRECIPVAIVDLKKYQTDRYWSPGRRFACEFACGQIVPLSESSLRSPAENRKLCRNCVRYLDDRIPIMWSVLRGGQLLQHSFVGCCPNVRVHTMDSQHWYKVMFACGYVNIVERRPGQSWAHVPGRQLDITHPKCPACFPGNYPARLQTVNDANETLVFESYLKDAHTFRYRCLVWRGRLAPSFDLDKAYSRIRGLPFIRSYPYRIALLLKEPPWPDKVWKYSGLGL